MQLSQLRRAFTSFAEMAVLLRTEMGDLRSDLRADIFDPRAEFNGQTTRLLFWLVPTVLAGMSIAARIG